MNAYVHTYFKDMYGFGKIFESNVLSYVLCLYVPSVQCTAVDLLAFWFRSNDFCVGL